MIESLPFLAIILGVSWAPESIDFMPTCGTVERGVDLSSRYTKCC